MRFQKAIYLNSLYFPYSFFQTEYENPLHVKGKRRVFPTIRTAFSLYLMNYTVYKCFTTSVGITENVPLKQMFCYVRGYVVSTWSQIRGLEL